MTPTSTARKTTDRDVLVIVSIILILVAALFTFEKVTGLPASIRGTPVYNALPMPSSDDAEALHGAAEEEESRIPALSDLTMERVCQRVVRSFASDNTLWQRVNERILRRLGFSCRH